MERLIFGMASTKFANLAVGRLNGQFVEVDNGRAWVIICLPAKIGVDQLSIEIRMQINGKVPK